MLLDRLRRATECVRLTAAAGIADGILPALAIALALVRQPPWRP